MKYWKGNIGTSKEGFYGTVDNEGFVPDSTETTETEYLDYVEIQINKEPKPKSDIEKLIEYAKKEHWI